MDETVKGMLENFAELIAKLGHIPNGNRIYYNRRSKIFINISTKLILYSVGQKSEPNPYFVL